MTPTYQSGFENRPTPTSLGWKIDTSLLKLYKFLVAKGKEPYFELLPEWTATYETPSRVYLDKPEYYSNLAITLNS